MEFKYMIVAFLEEQSEGAILEPPKNPHITVKKKFKLLGMGQNGLTELLGNSTSIKGAKQAITGGRGAFGSTENMIVRIKNDGIWIDLHKSVLKLLDKKIESRDPHFEGENYLPHITWRL